MEPNRPSAWQGLRNLFGRGQARPPDLDDAAQELVDNARAFDRLRIEDIMVPRVDIDAVDVEIGIPDLARAFIAAAHSRMPVYRDNLDDPIGMIHIKDLLPALVEKETASETEPQMDLAGLVRKVLYVPPSMNADDLLVRMQKTRVHMALVVDEYGGTDGLVTFEDLIEQIVGNIEDEHDTEEVELKELGPNCWEASARLRIEDMEQATGVRFRNGDEDEVETLGGLIFTMAGRVPATGEVLRHAAGYEFEIKRADPRRILGVFIRKTESSADAVKTE
jgi:CBS domain containing-hemolysin-like protein